SAGMSLLSHTAIFLLPLLLLRVPGPHLHFSLTDAHSLCLDLIGSVDKKPFLQYDSDSNTFRPLGLLREKINATNQELRMVLPVIRLEKNRTRGLPTFQVKLSCQREAEQCTAASWQFSFNGQTAVFDTMSMNWTVIDPGARGTQEEWENSQDLAEHFRKISAGDCNHWLREFLEHWEKVLEPTVQSVKFSDNYQASSIQLITWIIPSIFICSVLIGIIITKHGRRSGTRKVRSRLASGSRGGHSLMRTWER
uniref:MHC class I-like antigen recognition-like domain-containing protein n=1 Tax=Equus asinus TaxID=9793 RepID=A0A8C4LJ37_EQUAS